MAFQVNPFLTSALMLPVLAMSPITQARHHAFYSNFLKHEQRVLIVGGDPWAVMQFRSSGVKAFGALIQNRRGVTPFHAVADAGALPFLPGIFDSVHYNALNPVGRSLPLILADALTLIQPAGQFIFIEATFPAWVDLLNKAGWVRRHQFGEWAIWERSGHTGQQSMFMSVAPPILYELDDETRYIGKCIWQVLRFAFVAFRGYVNDWTPNEWVQKTTERLDHEHVSTLLHSERTMDLMRGFGRFLKWSPEEINDGYLAAGIHDIGKLCIPSKILEKPSALSAEEALIMRRHVTWSVRFVRWMPGFERVVQIVADHHESNDGSGYPRGVRGREIAQITHALAVVDAFDAMTHDRYYRPARSQQEAFDELRLFAVKQFDPDLVEAFIWFMTSGPVKPSGPSQSRGPFQQGQKSLKMSA